MIDYCKIQILNVDLNWIKNRYDFLTEFKPNTSEVSEKYTYKLHYSTITIYPSNIILFRGSLHKLYNSIYNSNIDEKQKTKVNRYNGYNANIYTLNNIYSTITYLTKFFNCNPEDLQFQNLEIGFNLNVSFHPNLFLKGLVSHKCKSPNINFNGGAIEFKHNNYLIKIYNKGEQYKLPQNILRVELKYKKSKELKPFGIKTMANINPNSLQLAYNAIQKRLNEIIYFDYTINLKTIKKLNRIKLERYKQPYYWNKELNKTERQRQKNNLQKLINVHSSNLKEQVKQILKKEFQKCILITQYNKVSLNPKCILIHSLNTERKSFKTCKLTGVDISMQKPNSFLLSHTGLYYYHKHDYKTYLLLKKKYLTLKWANSNKQIQIKEMAHNIRNYMNNKRIKQQKIYNNSNNQINLLDEFNL
jgi:hypothetical protein